MTGTAELIMLGAGGAEERCTPSNLTAMAWEELRNYFPQILPHSACVPNARVVAEDCGDGTVRLVVLQGEAQP